MWKRLQTLKETFFSTQNSRHSPKPPEDKKRIIFYCTAYCADLVGLEHAGILVHRADREEQPVPQLVLRRASNLLLDDRLLQRAGIPHRNATGTQNLPTFSLIQSSFFFNCLHFWRTWVLFVCPLIPRLHTTSNGNKLKTVESWINFIANWHLLWIHIEMNDFSILLFYQILAIQ